MIDTHPPRTLYAITASITVLGMLLTSGTYYLSTQASPQTIKSEAFDELLKQQQAREASIHQVSYRGTVKQYAPHTLERLANETVDDYVSRCASVDPDVDAKVPAYPIRGSRDFVTGIYEFSIGDIKTNMPKFMHWFIGRNEFVQLMGRNSGTCEALITNKRADIQDDHRACLVRFDTNAFRPINDRVMSEVLMNSASERGVSVPVGRLPWKLERMKNPDGWKATFMTQREVSDRPGAKQILWYSVYWQMTLSELVITRVDELSVVGDGDSMPFRVTLLDDYRAVAGSPIPFRVRHYILGKSIRGTELRVEEAKVNDAVEVPIALRIPEGTPVRNMITGRNYRESHVE